MQTIGMTGRIGPESTKGDSKWWNVNIHVKPHPLHVERIVRTGIVEPMFTLTVDDERHAYSSEGLISKNTAADWINERMCALHYDWRARIVLQHHDALVLEVPEDKVERWVGILRHVMQTPVPELGGPTLPIEVSVGKSWGEMEKWKE
jgi:hypothetical protein